MKSFTDFLRKMYPDADFDRYRFKEGDIIELSDGAKVLCISSAIYYIDVYVVKRSLKYREYKQYRVPYDELPYIKDNFVSAPYSIQKKLRWKVGDIINDNGNIVYLYSEQGHQKFYGWVIKAVNEYYLHTGIYIQNPNGCYVIN